MNTEAVYQAIKLASERKAPPEPGAYLALVRKTVEVLASETPDIRPANDAGQPGGLLRLLPDLPTVVLPDLHARRDFLLSLLSARPPAGFTRTPGTVLELLEAGRIQLLCLGDGFHAESRALQRWRQAYVEYAGNYRDHQAMDQEMCEGLGLMEMVMLAKTAFPGQVHFLKGNHENVLNETGDGNYGFYKFVQEGAMVRDYLDRFYGDDFVRTYAAFEKSLPLCALGSRFLASHAEPSRAFSREELVNAARLPTVIEGLTWTGNGEARPGTVAAMLADLLPGVSGARYLSGHRPVSGLFSLRNGGLHIQIHNPDRRIVAWVPPDRNLEPEKDVRELG